jgi:Predicted dehydrogenases and related proteins
MALVGDTALGIALIGAGGMAKHYRDSYVGIPGTEYRLVVDVNPETARDAAESLGVGRWSTDWRDALADDIHIADISTPNHLHTEQAVALLGAGKHVLLQKPMAPSVAECQAIVAAAKAAGRLAGVYMSDLEDPLVWDLREIVQGGYIGRLSSVRARYAHRGGLRAQATADNWRGSAEKVGGGAFMQLSIHHINLLCWVLDDAFTSVMGYSKNLMCPNIGGEDLAACVCEFEKTGALGVFESAWNADLNTVEVFGSEGRMLFGEGQGGPAEAQLNRPFAGRVIRVDEPGRPIRFPRSGGTSSHCHRDNPLNQHVAFVRAVLEGQPAAPVPAEVGLYDVAVVKAVYASAEQGRRVPVAEILAPR